VCGVAKLPGISDDPQVTRLPIRDGAGNILVDFRVVAEEELTRLAKQVPVAASGETARQAAVRELCEETGISGVELTFAAVAEFDMSPLDAEIARRTR
jgi:8-oxo-dGTP diphosphatase